jgi:replicative DNA helicase
VSLPQNQEAEESVIGGILVHPRVFNLVASVLHADDFHHSALRSIYEAIIELERASRPIDILTVADQMRALGTLDRLRAFGGGDYFLELQAKVVTVENLEYHAKIVAQFARARRTISAAASIQARGCGNIGDVEEFLGESERLLLEAAAGRYAQSYLHSKPILRETISEIEKRYDRGKAITGVPTGFEKLDEMTLGLQPGDLVIIGGRPSMGKTAFAMNMVEHVTIEARFPALVFSIEMTRTSLMARGLASQARIDSNVIRSGQLSTRDWVRLQKAASRIAESPLFIDDSGSMTLLDVRSKARRWREDKRAWMSRDGTALELGIIVIDYLQLLSLGAEAENRQIEVSQISKGLKALAKELRVPVVALSQLSRTLEERSDKRPKMSDLRESGAIEQDADVVAFIYRDEVYKKEESKKPGVAEIIVGKQRNGPIGTIELAFDGAYSNFGNLAPRNVEERRYMD